MMSVTAGEREVLCDKKKSYKLSVPFPDISLIPLICWYFSSLAMEFKLELYSAVRCTCYFNIIRIVPQQNGSFSANEAKLLSVSGRWKTFLCQS